jgi:hypothetical protein
LNINKFNFFVVEQMPRPDQPALRPAADGAAAAAARPLLDALAAGRRGVLK